MLLIKKKVFEPQILLFGEWMTHFKRLHMSCVSNSLPSQVNTYVLVVTTGNANAANGAQTIGENMHALVGGCTTGYIGILWNILGTLWSVRIVSLEKHPIFLAYYSLALGRTSSCKTLLQCMIWQFSMQFVWKGGGKPPGWRCP